jgi:tetratricopeptide (TPR) repeat protein
MEHAAHALLKSLAAHAAESFADPVAARALRLAALMTEGSQATTDRSLAESARSQVAANDCRVGIWESQDGMTFTRALSRSAEWGHWADRHTLTAAKTARRVVLLGESVARGFLYDPKFNVAKGLEQMCRVAIGTGVDIVDLACLGQALTGLAATLKASAALRPDALIIFAGNNWHSAIHATIDAQCQRTRVAALLNGGIAALQRQCEADMAAKVEEFLDEVAAHAKVPVVIVVPEYNLADWRDAEPIVPWLATNGNETWQRYANQARELLRRGDYDGAAALAAEMIALDQGVNAYSLRMLGECKSQAGLYEEARRLFEQSRDAALWDPSRSWGRAFSVVQRTLRQGAERRGFAVVDLPELFRRHLDGALPDRRLFLDHCHLSMRGIHVATAAMAEKLAVCLGHPRPLQYVLKEVRFQLDPDIEAQAHFWAAIHNAHWGHDNTEIVEYHCRTAVEKSPAIHEIMRDYVELSTRRAPGWMCAGIDRVAKRSKNPALTRSLTGMFAQEAKTLDEPLCQAVGKALGNADEIEALRIAEHGGGTRGVSLLTPLFSVRSVGQREANWLKGGATNSSPSYYRSYNAESRFVFVSRPGRAAELHVVARLPRTSSVVGRVEIAVNGQTVFAEEVSSAWRAWTIGIPAAAVRRGINEVVFHWPAAGGDAADALREAADDLLFGRIPEYFPVFGEVHSLVCAPVTASPPETPISVPSGNFNRFEERTPGRVGGRE